MGLGHPEGEGSARAKNGKQRTGRMPFDFYTSVLALKIPGKMISRQLGSQVAVIDFLGKFYPLSEC